MRNFYWCQPALNFGFANPDPNLSWQLPTNHPDVMAMRKDLKDVLRFWMDMGADGFRADMAGALVKTRNVRGNEQFFNTNENETKLFWREIRQMLETEYPQGFMVAEWSYPADALETASTSTSSTGSRATMTCSRKKVGARAAGKDVVLVMLNPKASASEATFNINVKFKKTKLLAGDRFNIKHDKKTGNVTVQMPATSYAIVKLM